MSNLDRLRKRLFYFSMFSWISGFFFAGSLIPLSGWYWRAACLIVAVVWAYVALTEYQDIIELYEDQTGSESSSEDREVIQVEVDESP